MLFQAQISHYTSPKDAFSGHRISHITPALTIACLLSQGRLLISEASSSSIPTWHPLGFISHSTTFRCGSELICRPPTLRFLHSTSCPPSQTFTFLRPSSTVSYLP